MPKGITVEGSYASLCPDFIFSTSPTTDHARWPWILLPLEVKRTDFKIRKEHERDIPIILDWYTTTSCGKRKRVASNASSRKTPRLGSSYTLVGSRVAGMNVKEFQLVSYLHEALAHGIRSYVSGMYIHDTEISLWYADRMGLVRTNSFDFVAKPQLLLLVIAAICSANIKEHGICPLLELPKKEFPRRFNTFKGSRLRLFKAQDDTGVMIEDAVDFQVVNNAPRYTQYGLVGRGTTILDVKAKGRKWQQISGNKRLIAKLSWPLASRTGEDTFIQVIRRKIPHQYINISSTLNVLYRSNAKISCCREIPWGSMRSGRREYFAF
jgi:Fungal protein kinase